MGPSYPSDRATTRRDRQRWREKSLGLVRGQLTGSKGPAPGVPADRRVGQDRRRERSLRAFCYGNFRPRRRDSRRADDQHRYIFDWHEPHLLFVALGIVLLSCTDALFTLNLLHLGAVEVNTFMNNMIGVGAEQFVWVKISMTVVSVLTLVFLAQRRFMGRFRVIRLLYGICACYFALIVYEIYLFCRILQLDLFALGSAVAVS